MHEALEQVKQRLVTQDGMVCNVTLDAGNWASVGPQVLAFLASLPSAPAHLIPWNWQTGGE